MLWFSNSWWWRWISLIRFCVENTSDTAFWLSIIELNGTSIWWYIWCFSAATTATNATTAPLFDVWCKLSSQWWALVSPFAEFLWTTINVHVLERFHMAWAVLIRLSDSDEFLQNSKLHYHIFIFHIAFANIGVFISPGRMTFTDPFLTYFFCTSLREYACRKSLLFTELKKI